MVISQPRGTTKDNLIAAATIEFANKGYAHASLREICSRAGVTTGALYFFFKSKDDLFRQVIAPFASELSKVLTTYFANVTAFIGDTEEGAENTADEAARGIASTYFENRLAARVLLNNREHPASREYFDSLDATLNKLVADLIAQTHPGVEESEGFDDLYVPWVTLIQTEGVMMILDKAATPEDAYFPLRQMAAFVRGGIGSVFEIQQKQEEGRK